MTKPASCNDGGVHWFVAYLIDYLGALISTLASALRLTGQLSNCGQFQWSVPIGIALVGGISTMLGQSVVLAINRVRGARRFATLLASGIGLVAVGVIQAAILALLTHWVVGGNWGLEVLVPIVLVAYAPYWFGFLVFLPYSGPGIARVLSVWMLVTMWMMIETSLGLARPVALILTLGAWLGTLALNWVFEYSPLRLSERIFRAITGRPIIGVKDLMSAGDLQ